ncbi:multidrug DMT transporter permease [Salmonella enterica subsp. enterica serovar Choleraesuis]|nr:multidrug DMT transporter permease [Salmonella enterica subsp. enterica serovar Choleraesuis]
MTNLIERKGIVELSSAMVIMGTVGLFVIESGQSVYNVVFYRCVIGVLFLVLFCLYSGKFKESGLTLKKIALIALSGVFLTTNWLMLFSSFKAASISTSTVIYHVQPFFFVLIWAAIFRERVSVNKIFWMALAFVGVALVANVNSREISFSSSYFHGIILALSAALCWAMSAIIVKSLKGISPYIVTLIQLVVGVVILLPFSELSGVADVTTKQWGCLLILGAVHTCLTYILMYSSYQRLSAPVIAVMTFIYPAVAILVDYYFYQVALTSVQVFGVFMIMFSSYAVNQNFGLFLGRRAN